MMRKIGLAATVVALSVAGTGTASAQPSLCEDTLEPAMQHYQIFSGQVQELIDQAGRAVCH
jgi:hypothetical protein